MYVPAIDGAASQPFLVLDSARSKPPPRYTFPWGVAAVGGDHACATDKKFGTNALSNRSP